MAHLIVNTFSVLQVRLENPDPEMTLLSFIRNNCITPIGVFACHVLVNGLLWSGCSHLVFATGIMVKAPFSTVYHGQLRKRQRSAFGIWK